VKPRFKLTRAEFGAYLAGGLDPDREHEIDVAYLSSGLTKAQESRINDLPTGHPIARRTSALLERSGIDAEIEAFRAEWWAWSAPVMGGAP
jgi:hypothetical protein